MGPFAMVYVFDCRQSDESYILRCPRFVAQWLVKRASAPLDYWFAPSGA